MKIVAFAATHSQQSINKQLAKSPGGRGSASVLETAVTSAPFFNGEVKASPSVPSFNENFDSANGKLSNKELDTALQEAVMSLLKNNKRLGP